MKTRTIIKAPTPETNYRGIIKKSGRGVRPTAFIADNGQRYDANKNKLFDFDVDYMEEIQTLDGDYVYRQPIDDSDEHGISVFMNNRGLYQGCSSSRVRVF